MNKAPIGPWRARHPHLGVDSALTWDLLCCAAVLFVVAAVAVLPAVRQGQDYHLFADRRSFAGIPNALDVLSNAGFAVVGTFGIWAALRPGAFPDPRARAAWIVLFGAVAATAAGSAYYHLAPADDRLAWDRLPMAVGFMALVAALLGERFGAAVGRHLLSRLVLAGVAAVAWWTLGVRHGGGNLLPYLIVQFGAVAAIPALLLGRPRTAGSRVPWLAALGLYAVAKILEVADRPLFAALGVSGHTLKHLVAAAAIGVLALEVHRRSLVSLRSTGGAPAARVPSV